MLSNIKQYFFTYVALLILFLGSLVLVSLIPSESLNDGIKKTIVTLKKEGIYPLYGVPIRQIILDNFTDSVMINTAYSVDSREPIKSALTNLRYEGITDSANQIANLEKLYVKEDIHPVLYERYWHGYLIYLRPLLAVFSYSEIRIILSLVLYSTFLIFMYSVWKKLGKKTALAFLIGFIATDFFYIGHSIQFSNIFLIGLWGGIYLLKQDIKNLNIPLFFFIIGGLTAFFDLLTAPLISLGIPLIIIFKLQKNSLKQILVFCISWSTGYLLLWLSKWITVQMLFTPGAIQTAFDQIVNRTVNEPDPNFSYINVIKLNFFQMIGYNRINKIIVLGSFLLAGILFIRYRIRKFSFNRIKFSLVIMGILPYLWYLVAANHSYLHVWYTYRIQFISIVSFALISMEYIDWNRIKKDFKIR